MKISELTISSQESRLERVQTSIWNKEISFTGKQLGDKDKLNIFEQLYTLLDAGVDVNTALNHIIIQSKKKTKTIVQDIQLHLTKGASLSKSFEETGKFSKYETLSIQIGEESGELLKVLQNLSEYLDEKIRQRREIIGALSYPVLIVSAAIGAVFFMIFFIIPVFEGVFARFGGELPGLTQQVIHFSQFLRGYSGWLVLITAGIFIAIRISGKSTTLRYGFEHLMFRMPLIKAIYRSSLLAKFSNSMGLLLQANVALIRAYELNEQMYGNLHLQESIKRIISDLVKGSSLSDAIKDDPIYDNNYKIMLKVGEESSRLGYFFKKLATDYRDSLKHKTSLLNTTLEPVLIVIIGLLVGTILISMYLPMFELSTQMSMPN